LSVIAIQLQVDRMQFIIYCICGFKKVSKVNFANNNHHYDHINGC